MLPLFSKYEVVLASKSPRRQELLKSIIPNFCVMVRETDEHYPSTLVGGEIPMYIAQVKAKEFETDLLDNQLLITADTIVWIDGKVLGKPQSREEAIAMLQMLSGKKHTVFTGVCIKTTAKESTFNVATDVYFRNLDISEIEFYVDMYKPFDKAGAYGIQEWIGYVGVERIDGSYFNVMGLPTQRLYKELKQF